ncbi:MAG: YwmB family TATA-box binding protein [Velocimicrobium sp.]
MRQYIMQHKKIKYYLMVLLVLWSGTVVNNVGQLFLLEETSTRTCVPEETTILLTQTFEGKLTVKQKDKIAYKCLNNYDATIVEEIKTPELYTIYAYSKKYDTYIKVDLEPINLNLVYYYNEITNETVLILATPIYNKDY